MREAPARDVGAWVEIPTVRWVEEIADPGARANAVGLVANVGLAVAKLAVGSVAGSAALVADGVNSAGDIFASAVGWAGYRTAQRPPDENHHFGHGKFESAAGLVIGGMLLATGVFVFVEGGRTLFGGPRPPPELLAVWVALATAGIKEALYHYATAVGRRLNAPSLLASARDHRADVFIAITVLAGVVGSRLGWTWLDPLAAACIGVYIAAMAWEPLRVNFGVLTDEAPPDVVEAVMTVARSVDGVRGVEAVRVHPLGSHYYVGLEIRADASVTLRVAHDLAHRVQDAVVAGVPHVRDARVHVNPDRA